MIHLQAYGVSFSAVAQFVFNRFKNVIGVLLVHVKLTVARYAKPPGTRHFVAREERFDKMRNDVG